MKKIHYIFLGIIILLLGAYFFLFKKDDGLNLSYTDPNVVFMRESDILSSDVVIEMTAEKFSPESVEIKKGQRVVFVNKTSGYAWPASDPHPTHTNYSRTSPNFDPEIPLQPEEAWAFTFEKIGNWKFHDHLDPSKRGAVTVGE